MAPRVILFAGAPAPLTINEASCTINHLQKPFRQFIEAHRPQKSDKSESDSSIHQDQSFLAHAVWRSLPLLKQPLHTGLTQAHQFQGTSFTVPQHGFFTTAQLSMAESFEDSLEKSEELLTQFCEHSLALHQPATSSQLEEESFDRSVTSNDETSIITTSSSKSLPQPVPCHLSDLEDIPTARQIMELVPQTITVNLIVGIISIAQPRIVTTRWGTTLTLIELLVGDDTKSGFGVTSWLSPSIISKSQVSELRRQDVVLLRNVALHVFRDKVYSQSLRKGLTQIHLLWRSDGSGCYSSRILAKRASSAHPQLDKTRQVREWVLDFVAVDASSRKRLPRKSGDQPPDDTP